MPQTYKSFIRPLKCGDPLEKLLAGAVETVLANEENQDSGIYCPVCEGWVPDLHTIEYARPNIDDDSSTTRENEFPKYGSPSTEIVESVKSAQERALIDPNERSQNAWDWHGAAELTFCEDIVGPGQVYTTPASSSCEHEEGRTPARVITDSTGMSNAVTLLNLQKMKDQTPSYKIWEENQNL